MAEIAYATVLHRALCEFKAEGDRCEECRDDIPDGADIFWVADGGESPDGTYVCHACACILTGLEPAQALPPQHKAD